MGEPIQSVGAIAKASGGWSTAADELIVTQGPLRRGLGGARSRCEGAVVGVMSRGSKTACTSMIYETVRAHAEWLREAGRA